MSMNVLVFVKSQLFSSRCLVNSLMLKHFNQQMRIQGFNEVPYNISLLVTIPSYFALWASDQVLMLQ